jgi:hypothetical protein
MKINDKYDKQKILIVEKHHQVLEAWEMHITEYLNSVSRNT